MGKTCHVQYYTHIRFSIILCFLVTSPEHDVYIQTNQVILFLRDPGYKESFKNITLVVRAILCSHTLKYALLYNISLPSMERLLPNVHTKRQHNVLTVLPLFVAFYYWCKILFFHINIMLISIHEGIFVEYKYKWILAFCYLPSFLIY